MNPHTGRDFVQFGKTESVLNKGAEKIAPLFNPPPVLSLEIILKRLYEKIYKDYPFDGKLLDIRQLSEFGQAFDAVRLDTMSEEELTLAKVHYYGLFC